MAQENEIKIIVEAEVKKALGALKSTQQESEKTAGVFKKTAQRIKQSWVGIAAGVTASIVGIKKAFDFTAEFASFQQSTTAMKNQFGKDADEVISKLKAVSGGTISNAKLVEGANRAMALNVTKDMDKMAQLLEVARFKAQAMGVDTTQAFLDITTGIGRNSPLILDNLGIITKGWAEEAKAAGVAMDQQFMLNKILKEGAKDIENAGGVTLTSAERFQQLSAGVENARLKIGEALLPVFEKIVPIIKTFVDGIGKLPNFLKLTGVAAVTLIPAILALNAAFGPIGIAIAAVAAGAIFLTGKLKELTEVTKEDYQESKKREAQAKRHIAAQKERIAMIDKEIEAELKKSNVLMSADDLYNKYLANKHKGVRLSKLETSAIQDNIKWLIKKEEHENKVLKLEKRLIDIQKTMAEEAKSLGMATDESINEYNRLKKELEGAASAYDNLGTSAQTAADKQKAIATASVEAIQQANAAIMDIYRNQTQERLNGFTAEREAVEQLVESEAITREEGDKRLNAIKQKERAEKVKAAKAEKAAAMFQIAIGQAVGATKIWAQWGAAPPVAIALSAMLAAVGIAQTAAVASQPIPAFAMGTGSAQGGPSIVGDAGTEIVDLPAGARVTPNHELMAMANSTVNNNESSDNRVYNIKVEANDPQTMIRKIQQQLGQGAFT